MKVKLSRAKWEEMGRKAGWIKTAADGYMPGQTPYADEEKATLNQLVDDAAKADVSESEEDALVNRRRTIRVRLSDGDHIVTDINGTVAEIRKYYLPYGDRGVATDYSSVHPNKKRWPVDVEFLG